jgi:hypothetical protein
MTVAVGGGEVGGSVVPQHEDCEGVGTPPVTSFSPRYLVASDTKCPKNSN